MMQVPNERDLKLDKYSISKYAYRELKYFCLQYLEKKRELARLHSREYLLHPMAYDGQRGGSGQGDPTAVAGTRAALLSADCELIEHTAIQAAPEIYQWILLSVVEGIPYEEIGRVPCGRRQFYEARRKFFFLLSRKRGNTEDVVKG